MYRNATCKNPFINNIIIITILWYKAWYNIIIIVIIIKFLNSLDKLFVSNVIQIDHH